MLGVVPALVLLVAGSVEVDGVVAVETRAGEAPVAPGLTPEATVAGVLTPAVSLALRAPSSELRFGYDLRIYMRETRSDPNIAPLFLHTLTFSGNTRATARLDLKAQATAMVGAADYAYLPYLLSPSTPGGAVPGGMTPGGMVPSQVNQATLAIAPQVFSAVGGAGADVRLTRTARFAFNLSGMHHRSIGDDRPPATQPMAPVFTLPHFLLVRATPALTLRLTRFDDLSVETAFEYQRVSELTAFAADQTATPYAISSYTAVPRVAWKATYPSATHLELGAGFAFTHLEATIPLSVDPNLLTPIGGATLDGRLLSGHDTVLTGSVAAFVEYFLDPVLGTAAPRGFATTAVTLGLPPDWSVAVQGNVMSSFNAHPRANGTTLLYYDEVVAALSLPVRHRLSNEATLEFGGRWADRSPFFTAPNAGFHQRQLWLYVLVTATTRRTPRAATP